MNVLLFEFEEPNHLCIICSAVFFTHIPVTITFFVYSCTSYTCVRLFVCLFFQYSTKLLHITLTAEYYSMNTPNRKRKREREQKAICLQLEKRIFIFFLIRHSLRITLQIVLFAFIYLPANSKTNFNRFSQVCMCLPHNAPNNNKSLMKRDVHVHTLILRSLCWSFYDANFLFFFEWISNSKSK